MTVRVRYVTDPASSSSWVAEPTVRRLMVEFGDELAWTFVMGGLARDYAAHEVPDGGFGGTNGLYPRLMVHWLDVAEEGRMPVDPRLWSDDPLRSSYPACMAVKAAAEQAGDGGYAYLRALREGIMCFRRRLDSTEPLVEEAGRVGLDRERFRTALASNAIVEAFGADLEEARNVPAEARAEADVTGSGQTERVPFPTLFFVGEDDRRHGVYGARPYEAYRAAAEAAGAVAVDGGRRPSVLEALRRFGRMGSREVEAVCDLPPPAAAGELWRLAAEWKVRPVRVLTDQLWELG